MWCDGSTLKRWVSLVQAWQTCSWQRLETAGVFKGIHEELKVISELIVAVIADVGRVATTAQGTRLNLSAP